MVGKRPHSKPDPELESEVKESVLSQAVGTRSSLLSAALRRHGLNRWRSPAHLQDIQLPCISKAVCIFIVLLNNHSLINLKVFAGRVSPGRGGVGGGNGERDRRGVGWEGGEGGLYNPASIEGVFRGGNTGGTG